MKMQMPGNQSDGRDEAIEAPARLVSALRELPAERVFVPSTIDESVLRAARTHLRPAPKPGLAWRRFRPWATATAAAVILIFLGLHLPNPGTRSLGGDVNGDGTIDILDAFALAKKVEAGATFGADIDLNGDGKVDQQDVAVLADKAVSLEKGGHS